MITLIVFLMYWVSINSPDYSTNLNVRSHVNLIHEVESTRNA